MIAAIATITEIELKSISAIVVATIAVIAAIVGEWFPYDRGDRRDHMEIRLKCTEKALIGRFENKQIYIQTQLLNCNSELRSYC